MQCDQVLSSRIREKPLFMMFQVKENEESHAIFSMRNGIEGAKTQFCNYARYIYVNSRHSVCGIRNTFKGKLHSRKH